MSPRAGANADDGLFPSQAGGTFALQLVEAPVEILGLLGGEREGLDAITVAFQGYSLAALAILLLCATLLLLTALPLLQRAARKHRARIFVSFQHHLEPVATSVQEALAQAGFRTLRLPYVPGASHQQVVMESNRLIRSAHAVVCLPGRDPSFVEAEIGGATLGFKPIAFLLPEAVGSLPNSADKRYPVFRLEETEARRFEPLATFLHYVVADLDSGWQQVKSAARHPLVWNIGYGALGLLGAILVTLFVLAYGKARTATEALASQGGVFSEVRQITVLAHVGVLVALAALILGVSGYTLLVVAGVWRQWRAQRRAALKAGRADFARDDWRTVIPGLVPGSDLYECLFESAPAAHHEEAARADASGAADSPSS